MPGKIKVLSIDWDYFIDADMKDRAKYFPDGTTDSSSSLQSIVWASRYAAYPETRYFGVTKEYDIICDFLRAIRRVKSILVADSHRFAYDFVCENGFSCDSVEVVNIDFHHDVYDSSSCELEVNAGNWALKLKEKFPQLMYKWVKKEDSERPDIPVETISLKEALMKKYDCIFLCRSGAWSPPHLDEEFVEMVDTLLGAGPVLAEKGIMDVREFEDYVAEIKEIQETLMADMKSRDKSDGATTA